MGKNDEESLLLGGSPIPSYSINPSESYAFSPDQSYPGYEDLSAVDGLAPMEDDEDSYGTHFEPHARKPYIPASDSAMASRMRYYNKLAAGGGDDPIESPALQLPAHVIPSFVFFPSVTSFFTKVDDKEQPEKKQSDIKLIFSIWNTMMGSSLLGLPWGFGQSGLTMGFFLVFFIGALCAYTCILIVQNGKDSADFFYLCNDYLGKWGKWLCWISSIAVLLGGVIAYDILMSEILFSSVSSVVTVIKNFIDNPNFPTSATGTNWWWNEKVTPIIVFVVMFPICNMKNFGIIVTINSLGVISIAYTVVFIVLQCTFEQGLEFKNSEGDVIPQINDGLFVLAGLLSISFYIHGMILPIIKSAKNPQNNVRNVICGYTLVAFSYAIVGGIGYLGYWYGSVPIPEEFLQIYDSYGTNTKIGVILANFLLLFQLTTVFPLLLLIIRIQVYGLILNSQYPGKLYVYGLNFALILIGTLFSLFYSSFASVLR